MGQLNRLMGFSRQIQMKIPPCSSVAPLWSYSLLSFHSGIAFLHHREADSPKMCIQSLQFTALVLCQSRCNSALKFALTRRWKEDLVCNPLKLDKLEKICMNLDWSMEWTNSQSIIKNLSHVLLFQNLSFLFLPVNLESGLTSFPFLLARSWKFSIPYLFCFLRCFHEVKRPSHLLLLNPVPAFLDTFPPDILHLLSSTFKPRINASYAFPLSMMITKSIHM